MNPSKGKKASKRKPAGGKTRKEPLLGEDAEHDRVVVIRWLRGDLAVAIFSKEDAKKDENGYFTIVKGLLPLVSSTVFIDAGANITRALAQDIGKSLPSTDGAHWARSMIDAMASAILECAASLIETRNLVASGTNVVTAVGDLVATEVKKRLILDALRRNDYVLSRTATELHIASGSAPLARMIRELGLAELVEGKRAELGQKRGGRPRKLRP